MAGAGGRRYLCMLGMFQGSFVLTDRASCDAAPARVLVGAMALLTFLVQLFLLLAQVRPRVPRAAADSCRPSIDTFYLFISPTSMTIEGAAGVPMSRCSALHRLG